MPQGKILPVKPALAEASASLNEDARKSEGEMETVNSQTPDDAATMSESESDSTKTE